MWLFVLMLAAVVAILPAVVAYRVAKNAEPVYQAQAEVMYDIDRAAFGEADKIMANAKITAEGRGFAATLAADHDMDVEAVVDSQVVSRVTVDDVTTSILRFEVQHPDPATAEAQVQDWVTAFVTEQRSADPDATERLEIEATIESLQQDRLAAQEAIAQAEQVRSEAVLSGLTTTRRAQLVAELDSAVIAAGSRYNEIISDINAQARLLEQLENDDLRVQVDQLGAAFASADPVSPQPVRNLVFGLAVGLVLATTVLFTAFQLRRR